MLRWGYRVPLLSAPPLSAEPIPFPSYSPNSIRGQDLEKEVQSLVQKGALELAPLPSPGFYSRIFVVMKALGSWRPVIDLSTLNLRVRKTPFKMETLQSVLLSVRSGDWMVSIDLKDAYLQIPVHLDSCKYLRFVALNQVFQFKALCFGLSTALQVFTWVMAPVSAILHRLNIRMCRYLDDWLIQASSHSLVLQALNTVVHLCQELGIIINREKSNLLPSQRVVYLGVILDSTLFRASPSLSRVEKLCLIAEEFLSCDAQPASPWLVLFGVLFSLTPLVPGGRLRIRSLQLRLHQLCDREDDSVLIPWDPACRQDLEWCLVPGRLQLGISLSQVNPHLDFWSDASDVGWGAHLLDETASGRWSPEESLLSINSRELLVVEYGLLHFKHLVSNSTVAVFSDNSESTALAYLRKQGGTRSTVLNSISQRILRWAETIDLVLAPQFIQGKNNVLADSLSRPNQVQGSEWTLKWEVFLQLNRKWPVMIDLFATSLNHHCSLYFSPFHDPSSIGTDALLQNWDGYQVYAFPPWSMIPLVLKKLR